MLARINNYPQAAGHRAKPLCRCKLATFAAVLPAKFNAHYVSAIRAIREATKLRINEIVGRTMCREVKIVFEASERADPLVEKAFEGLQVRRGWKDIPTQWLLHAERCQ